MRNTAPAIARHPRDERAQQDRQSEIAELFVEGGDALDRTFVKARTSARLRDDNSRRDAGDDEGEREIAEEPDAEDEVAHPARLKHFRGRLETTRSPKQPSSS